MSVLKISETELSKLRSHLLAWFAQRKRDLPWRRTDDPFRIWISEIMLQQTRVAAVIPYYEQFLAKFPTVQKLALARPETVLGQWSGLGYYSRARNLHRAAKEIVAQYDGCFPSDYEAALALPGIGRYTAAAVLSIAYSKPLAVLDGNVARVLARLGAVRGDLRASRTWRKLESAAQGLLACEAPGDWNQAMMELGATVCTPKSPLCNECPIAEWCRARELGIVEKFPAKRVKRPTVEVTLAAAVLLNPRGQTLLVRPTSEDGALFSRLWQFPAIVSTEDPPSDLARYLQRKFQIETNGNLKALRAARHAVTFRNVRLVPFVFQMPHLPKIERARTPMLNRLGSLPISNATRKIAFAALDHCRRMPGGLSRK